LSTEASAKVDVYFKTS